MKPMLPVLGLLLCFSTAHAATLDELGQQMSLFYLEPTADSFLRFQKEADVHAAELAARPNAVALLVSVFLYRAAEKHDWKIASQSEIGRVAKALLSGSSSASHFVNDDANVTPTKLDVWWVSFFATGDTRYLDRLMQFAGLPSKAPDVPTSLLVGSATWSFKSNCQQHPAIRKYAEDCLRDGKYRDRRTFLQECLRSSDQKASAPARSS